MLGARQQQLNKQIISSRLGPDTDENAEHVQWPRLGVIRAHGPRASACHPLGQDHSPSREEGTLHS